MKAERVVPDTNVLISAALRRNGRPRAVVDAVREERGVRQSVWFGVPLHGRGRIAMDYNPDESRRKWPAR